MAIFRYKYVQNSTDAGLTIANFPVTNDGDNKQPKTIRRILTEEDIGTDPGQIGHTSGLILDVIPVNYNVLWFDVRTYKPVLVGVNPNEIYTYNLLDNQVVAVTFDDPDYEIESYEITFWLAKDNTLRVFDKGHLNPVAALVEGDHIVGNIIIGQPQDTRDKMNP